MDNKNKVNELLDMDVIRSKVEDFIIDEIVECEDVLGIELNSDDREDILDMILNDLT